MTNSNQLPVRRHAGSPRCSAPARRFLRSGRVHLGLRHRQPVPAAKLAPGDKSNGADNFYASDSVSVQKVCFKNQYKMNVVGNLFVPKGLKGSAKTPAIVVGTAWVRSKSRAPTCTRPKMAEQGFITLSLDLSFWGESDGQPRNTVAPESTRKTSAPRSTSCAPSHPSIGSRSVRSEFAAAGASSSAPPRSTRASEQLRRSAYTTWAPRAVTGSGIP